jgi:hypothetical protein
VDVESGKTLQTFQGHTHRVNSVALSGDGKRVLTGSKDKTARLWDVESGKTLQTFQGHTDRVTSTALSSDGKRVLTGSHDKTARLWDVESGKTVQTFQGHTDAVFSVASSGDGKRLLTGSGDKTARLWDVESGKTLQTFQGHTWGVTSVALSSDGKRVLTGGSWDHTARLWDIDSGKTVQTFQGHMPVTSVALSSDGKCVLTGSWDHTGRLWDAQTGKTVQTFKGHTGHVSAVAFGPGNHFLVTASEDGTTSIWRPGRDRPIFSFLHASDEWIFWTPEGYYTCSPGGEDLIAWKIDDPAAPHGYRIVGPEQFRKTFRRPDLFRHLFNELDLARALAKADRDSGRPAEQPTTVASALPPTVTLIQPRKNVDTEDERLTVEAAAHSVGDHPVLRLRLNLDGRPYDGNRSTFNVPSPRLGEVSRTWKVDLKPGSHTIEVIAESKVSEGRSSRLTIRRTTPVARLPQLIVLAIGISEYDSQELRKDVEYAASDAEKVARVLQTRGKSLYREVKVISLLNKDATRRKILRALGQVRKEATQRDTVVIFFAGHGWRSPQNRFYFLTADTDPEDKEATALSEGDFNPAVLALLPGKVLLLLDACHSATLIENAGRSSEGPTDRLLTDLTSNEFGLVMMCSSRGMEKSLESRRLKGGHFTTAVVEGLEGKARRQYGAIYVTTLDEYVKARVQELTEGSQHPASRVPATITDIPLTKP